jgi:TolA-binding protein
MKIRLTAHRTCFAALGLLWALAVLFFSVTDVGAKLPADRWTRLTEEERHQLTRAERYVEQNNFKSALAEYELFIQLYGKSEVASYAQFMFAECTRRLGQVNGAINEFRNVIDYFPDSIDAGNAQYSIGVCQTQGGDVEQAVVAFEKVSAKWPKADFGALARSELCAIYWRLGKVEKWLPHMEYLATGEYTDSTNLHANSQRRFLMHRLIENKPAEALALIDPKRKKDALTTFSEWAVEALRVQNVSALYGEKGTKALPGIAATTVTFIEKESAAATDAEQKTAFEHRCARILASAGVSDKAMERFAALAKKNPDNDTIRSEYAAHLRASGKRGEARLVYHELKNQYVADTEIAETYGEENNWKSCIEAYQAMLNKHPQQANQIQWRLGEVLSRTGKYPEAIACYNQSQREPQSLFRIAECQGSMKQHDAAIQTLVGVLNFFKSAAPEAQYRIAGHYAAKGDKEAAIRTLKTVCKVHLSTSWAGKAHQDLSLTYGIDVTLGGAAKQDEK